MFEGTGHLVLDKFASHQITIGGSIRMVIAYTTTIKMLVYIPNEAKGIIGLPALAANAAAVVLEVVKVARAALLNA